MLQILFMLRREVFVDTRHCQMFQPGQAFLVEWSSAGIILN
jgi:hypothetical protein